MKLFFLLSLLPFTAMAAMDVPQIQVQGKCDMKIIPDRGSIVFNAENQAKDQKDAVKKSTTQIENLKEAVKGLKLKDFEMKNTQYNVYPVREYEKDRMVDKGFRAVLSLEIVTSEISRIGEAMMKASAVGITGVGALNTFLSLEKSQEEYLKCLDVAADDARKKANQLGKKLGFKVGDVISLIEAPVQNSPVPQPPMMMAKIAMDESASPQIESGTHQYSTNIQVTFSIK